ncbi:MAG: NADH-quinone oxidoreductase subunit A [Omnitrophica WOR_2 bacterium GWA2_47_8]|nr:MAG: NADH-quinone oxidoreductase subunit A [Omnitrophica WOR_2 bacterium GWA2_47_8]
MIPDYIYILSFIGLGIFFVGAAFTVSWLIRPNPPYDPVKVAPYECGEIVKGNSRVQFNVRYYLFALIFVIFDVEVLFVVPWAVVFKQLGMVAYIEMLIFIFILTLGLLYAWKKGALEWQ